MHNNIIAMLLWHALVIFLLGGALFGMLMGLLLICKPQLLQRIGRVSNRWISTQFLNQWLDHSVSIERWFYRNHRPMGMMIICGAGYVIVYFSLLFDKVYALRHLSLNLPSQLVDGLLDALVAFLLIGAPAALLAGLIIFRRPSVLRSIEKGANQWVSLARVGNMLDRQFDQVDAFATRHAQSAGCLLLLASAYLFYAMYRLLL